MESRSIASRLWRPVIALVILTTTVGAFITYFVQHPAVRQQLAATPAWTVALILLLYGGFIISLALVNSATVRLCRVKLSRTEAVQLTAYSTIINFFGPLQSGPAFRAIYLKKKHQINLKQYAVATIVYYLFYALFSGLFLVSGILGWWLVLLATVGLGVLYGVSKSTLPIVARFKTLDVSAWYQLAGAVLLQMTTLAGIYYVELRSIMPTVKLGASIIYTGAANFALFVSLTPGAIGFRESFLVFSQRLHHISNSAIVLANTIDRATYLMLLIILGIIVLATHTKDRFS